MPSNLRDKISPNYGSGSHSCAFSPSPIGEKSGRGKHSCVLFPLSQTWERGLGEMGSALAIGMGSALAIGMGSALAIGMGSALAIGEGLNSYKIIFSMRGNSFACIYC